MTEPRPPAAEQPSSGSIDADRVEVAVESARMVLAVLVEPGNKALYQLVAEHGPIEALDRIVAGHAPDNISEAAAIRLNRRSPGELAERLRAQAERLGARIIVPESPQWPAQLDDLCHISVDSGKGTLERDTFPPHCIWLRGPSPLAACVERSVALIGARENTEYGAHVAADIAFGLVERGWTVVSGGAFGIDACAHRGALAGSGTTVAVLACGVDRPYPASNSAMFERIAETGLLLSEWPPGTAPFKHRFLVRNRVIAALSKGTVLVEASARSGARQTLRRARQLGRSTMIVPGSIYSTASVGCHEELRLVENEARLVTSARQVLEEVGVIGEDLAPPVRGPQEPYDSLEFTDRRLVDAVPKRGRADPMTIARAAGVSLREALARLPSLALRGHLGEYPDGFSRALPGGRSGP